MEDWSLVVRGKAQPGDYDDDLVELFHMLSREEAEEYLGGSSVVGEERDEYVMPDGSLLSWEEYKGSGWDPSCNSGRSN